MRRPLLITTFVLMVLIDLSLLPMALLLIYLGAVFAGVGHGLMFLPMTVIAVALAAALVWLTVILGRAALQRPAAS